MTLRYQIEIQKIYKNIARYVMNAIIFTGFEFNFHIF